MPDQFASEGSTDGRSGAAWGRTAVEAAANIGAATAGLAVAGPGGVVLGAAITPFTMTLWDDFAGRYRNRRDKRAIEVLGTAAAAMGTTVDGLIGATCDDPMRELLVGKAVTAAGNTALDAKVAALGRALASALAGEDAARLDESALVLSAIADLEAPHIRVLALFCTEPKVSQVRRNPDGSRTTFEDYGHPLLGLRQVQRRLPHYPIGLEGLIGTLVRHGLLVEKPVDLETAFKAYRSHSPARPFLPNDIKNQRSEWRGTSLGSVVFEYLSEAAKAVDVDPSVAPPG